MIKSVIDYLEISVQNYADKIAVSDEIEDITFLQLKNKSLSLATVICKEYNIKKQPIAVFMNKSAKCISAFMGIVYSGNIYCPLDIQAPLIRIKKIFDILSPKAIIADEAGFEVLKNLKISENIIMYNEAIQTENDNNIISDICRKIIDTDPLYILFTSGSTGIPKGVLINHRAVIDFTEESTEAMNFSDKEIFANQAPFYFDASVPDIYCMLKNGATLYVPPKELFSFPIKLLQYVKEKQVNAIFWVPSALILVANMKALGKVDISCIKKVMFCGEVMPNKQLNIWRKHLPNALYVNYYGPSEATYACTYYKVDREFSDTESLPIGKACLNTDIIVLDEQNNIVEDNTIGELCIRGSSLSMGYYNNPEKTKEAFVQNPLNNSYNEIIYRTGDLVKFNEYGELVYVSRKDYQIKHMGYRIELGEIETAVNSLSKIIYSCCLYDDKSNKIVLIYQSEEDDKYIISGIKDILPQYMIPNKFIKLDDIPFNANGKIDRVKLKQLL